VVYKRITEGDQERVQQKELIAAAAVKVAMSGRSPHLKNQNRPSNGSSKKNDSFPTQTNALTLIRSPRMTNCGEHGSNKSDRVTETGTHCRRIACTISSCKKAQQMMRESEFQSDTILLTCTKKEEGKKRELE
jgi:hypothetical protein